MDPILREALVPEDVAHEYGLMMLEKTSSEYKLPSKLIMEMRKDFKIIDLSRLTAGDRLDYNDHACRIPLSNMVGIYKTCTGQDKEGQKVIFKEVAVYLKLRSLQGDRLPKLLLYGVTEGPGAADVFMITEYYGEPRKPSVDDVFELENIIKEVHSHGILLGGVPHVVRSGDKLLLCDLSMAVFEKRKAHHRQELEDILGKCM